jgi:hypothetical protein
MQRVVPFDVEGDPRELRDVTSVMSDGKLIRSLPAAAFHCVHSQSIDERSCVQVAGHEIDIDIPLSRYVETVILRGHRAFQA